MVQHKGALLLRAAIGAATAALAVVVVTAGEPDRPGWWTAGILFWLWMVSPVLAASKFAGERPSTARLAILWVFLVGFVGSSAWGYFNGLLNQTSSTSSLIVIFLPLYQWAMLIALVTLQKTWGALSTRGAAPSREVQP
jgi:hypothetical protein